MLIYHPAFDIYHGIFRILRILDKIPSITLEIDRLRILDFYLLFPNELSNFTFPAELRNEKSRLPLKSNPYRQINDPKRIFFRLEPYQICALKSLVAREFIDESLFLEGKVQRTENPLPEALSKEIQQANEPFPALVEFLTGPLLNIDLYGKSGLKGRSDLFEYRYDLANSTTGT